MRLVPEANKLTTRHPFGPDRSISTCCLPEARHDFGDLPEQVVHTKGHGDVTLSPNLQTAGQGHGILDGLGGPVARTGDEGMGGIPELDHSTFGRSPQRLRITPQDFPVHQVILGGGIKNLSKNVGTGTQGRFKKLDHVRRGTSGVSPIPGLGRVCRCLLCELSVICLPDADGHRQRTLWVRDHENMSSVRETNMCISGLDGVCKGSRTERNRLGPLTPPTSGRMTDHWGGEQICCRPPGLP